MKLNKKSRKALINDNKKRKEERGGKGKGKQREMGGRGGGGGKRRERDTEMAKEMRKRGRMGDLGLGPEQKSDNRKNGNRFFFRKAD